MLWAWETTARYLFKGCRKMVLTIPMSQSVLDVGALKVYVKGRDIVVEGVWIPTLYQETDMSQPQPPYVASTSQDALSPLLTSPPYQPASERRVLS